MPECTTEQKLAWLFSSVLGSADAAIILQGDVVDSTQHTPLQNQMQQAQHRHNRRQPAQIEMHTGQHWCCSIASDNLVAMEPDYLQPLKDDTQQ